MELLSIQGNLDLITKTELIEWARRHDIPLTGRDITVHHRGIASEDGPDRIVSRLPKDGHRPAVVCVEAATPWDVCIRDPAVAPALALHGGAIGQEQVGLAQQFEEVAANTLTSEEAIMRRPGSFNSQCHALAARSDSIRD